MKDDLLGYLLNAVDPDERRQTEKHLRNDAAARRRLKTLRDALAPLEADRSDPDPPPRLVERTLARALGASPVTLARDSAFPTSRWRRVDVLVACTIMVLVGGLGASGLARIQGLHYTTACQNNLRKLSGALNGFAAVHNGAFPLVSDQPPRNYAASFAPTLVESGQLGTESSPNCPVSPAPKDMPAYAYSLGYRDANGKLHGLRRDGEHDDWDLMPILADRQQPLSHGPGFNVLFIGGSVRFCTSPNVGIDGDNIYLNQANRVAAGVHRVDSVLADGHTAP